MPYTVRSDWSLFQPSTPLARTGTELLASRILRYASFPEARCSTDSSPSSASTWPRSYSIIPGSPTRWTFHRCRVYSIKAAGISRTKRRPPMSQFRFGIFVCNRRNLRPTWSLVDYCERPNSHRLRLRSYSFLCFFVFTVHLSWPANIYEGSSWPNCWPFLDLEAIC